MGPEGWLAAWTELAARLGTAMLIAVAPWLQRRRWRLCRPPACLSAGLPEAAAGAAVALPCLPNRLPAGRLAPRWVVCTASQPIHCGGFALVHVHISDGGQSVWAQLAA